ncbi:hypothetical protein GGH94_002771 [Coemansia aciculifera]|uniref:Uncharacterized protein n=1 Tax=Coemansia aciculifera TaxID=417176 RepID=A0A9W8II96_9FUNG|nr:hypothetical protein GGH94_002771 [Coemansia aciculifera]KAJ2874168.1 hypothetical protein GGH93_002610 [Coemansia aciculifera]
MPMGVAPKTLPAYVIDTCGLMSKRFRHWHFECQINVGGGHVQAAGKTDEAAKYVLLLELVCPNFGCINPSLYLDRSFVTQLHKTYGRLEFELYAERLWSIASKE